MIFQAYKKRRESMEENLNVKSVINITKGIIISFIITIILFYILGIILTYTNIPEKIITPAIIVITGISILIGTSISLMKTKEKGLIKGGIIGSIYFLLIYLISSGLLQNFEVNIYSIIMLIATFICGCIGGVVGVNIKS